MNSQRRFRTVVNGVGAITVGFWSGIWLYSACVWRTRVEWGDDGLACLALEVSGQEWVQAGADEAAVTVKEIDRAGKKPQMLPWNPWKCPEDKSPIHQRLLRIQIYLKAGSLELLSGKEEHLLRFQRTRHPSPPVTPTLGDPMPSSDP